MGDSHDNVTIADDEKRVYLHGYQVDLLNEYDAKCKAMESQLEELGYKLVFIREEYNMASKKFETAITTTPGVNDDGEWVVMTKEEFEKFAKKRM